MKNTVWPLLVLLVILHHDFWFWDDSTLVAGWFPIGLLYHVGLSIVAAVFWLFAVKRAWPSYLAEDSAGIAKPGPSASDSAEVPQA